MKYLISFPSGAMVFPEEDFAEVARAAHAVIEEAKEAGVYVFGGGIDESIDPVLVRDDETISTDTYPRTSQLKGGFTVIEAASREDAVRWAARIAAACRCPQELQQFQYDPAS